MSPHLHVPLQSGDDGVLRAMGRRYTVAAFARRLERLDGIHLTTDVIVGFPAEDDAAFERTLRLVEELGMTKVHVFPYSPRPGTRTAADDPIPVVVKRERSARLRALSDDLCRRRWAGRLGSTDRVLLDRPGRGYADDYTPWLVDGARGDVRDRPRGRPRGRGGACRCRLSTRLSLLRSRPRRRPRQRERGLRRDPRHRATGADAPARPAGAPRRHVPPDRGVLGGRVEAHARVRRGDGEQGRARRLPRDGARRSRRPGRRSSISTGTFWEESGR